MKKLSKNAMHLGISLFLMFLLFIVAVGGLSGCNSATNDGQRKLTAEEIKKTNAAFSATVNDDKEINPLGIYLIYNYDSPYDLNLSEFLAYFPSEEDVTDETEFEHLKKSEHWPFGQDAQLSTMPVPIHKFPTSVVDKKLKEGFGIGLKDLSDAQKGELMYSEEYDCFYNTTSDACFGYFSCTDGYIDRNTAVLIGENRRLELHLEDGKWLFYSLTEISDNSDFADSKPISVAGLGLESNEVAPDGLNTPSNSDFALDAQRKEYMDILEKLEFSDITYLAVYLSPNDSSLKTELTTEQSKAFFDLIKSVELTLTEPTNPSTGGTFSMYIVTENDILNICYMGSVLFINNNSSDTSWIFSGESCSSQFLEMQNMIYELFEN